MKKALIIIGILIILIIAAAAVGGYHLYRKPSVRFMLIASDIMKPYGYQKKEIVLKLKEWDTPMTVISPVNSKPGKYYFFLHGFSPEAYRHPTLEKLAAGIATATGRTVFVPFIRGITKKDWTLAEVARQVGGIYMQLKQQRPGRYNAFGACVAGTGLMVAFNTIPVEEYPEKLFLYGPFFTGKLLVEYYNKAGVEVDYMVKMANALNSRGFSDKERRLVADAILASKPGTTDREAMRAILGDELFNRLDESKVDNKEFVSINEGSIFTKGRKMPDTEFFVMHSTSDNIIPYTFGLSLHKFILACGGKSRFVATRIFSHSESKFSLSESYKELTDIIHFLDDLFSDDNDGD